MKSPQMQSAWVALCHFLSSFTPSPKTLLVTHHLIYRWIGTAEMAKP